jgi:hypothetical protein
VIGAAASLGAFGDGDEAVALAGVGVFAVAAESVVLFFYPPQPPPTHVATNAVIIQSRILLGSFTLEIASTRF